MKLNKSKWLVVIIGVFVLFFSSCEKEEITPENLHQSNFKKEEGSFKQFGLSNLTTKLKIYNSTQNPKSNLKAEAEDGFYFTIDTTQVIKLSDGITESYTMKVSNSQTPNGAFQNLVIAKYKNLEPKAYLYTYHPDEDYNKRLLLNTKTYFSGKAIVSKLDINKIKFQTEDDCSSYTIAVCNHDLQGNLGELHMAGLGCGGVFYISIERCLDSPSGGTYDGIYNDSSLNNGEYNTIGTGGNLAGASGVFMGIPTQVMGSLDLTDTLGAEIASQFNFLQRYILFNLEKTNFLINNPQIITNVYNYLNNNVTTESITFTEQIIKLASENPQPLYDTTNYPGKADGMPFEWWKDENQIEIFFQDKYETWKKLTREEKILSRNFPNEALIIYKNKEIALQKTIQIFGNVPDNLNGKADAFRHAFYQAINTVSLRKYSTKLFANAHESETPLRWNWEKKMDLFNNEVGMDFIEFRKPNMTNINQIAQEILNLLTQGELMYLYPINYNSPNFYDNPNTLEKNDGDHGISTSTLLIPTN